jgi:hypothetical protein
VSAVKYELGFYIPEDDIPHSHRRMNLKSYLQLDCLYRQQMKTIAKDAQKIGALIWQTVQRATCPAPITVILPCLMTAQYN